MIPRHPLVLLLPMAALMACTEDALDGKPPSYGTEDTGSSTSEEYKGGSDPYEEGEQRAGIGDTYEGPSSDTIAVDDVNVFFYVYEDTIAAIQNFEETAEGLYSQEWVSKGRGWWGGGIHHTTGTFDLSEYATLHIAMKSGSDEMADVSIGMITDGATSDATVSVADYGWANDGEWHAIEIPLVDFVAEGADLTAITSPLFLLGEGANTEGESIWFDDIYLTDHAGSTRVDPDDDTGDDPGVQTSLLDNGGFESHSTSADGVERPDVWAVYPPDRTQWGSSLTGDTLGSGSFTALEGAAALHVMGADTGAENETAIYQTFDPVAGATYTFTGSAYMPADQAIAEAHSYAMLQIKMFNSSWGMVDSFDSAWVDMGSTTETWIALEVSGDASSSVVYVQAAVEFWQCVGETAACVGGEGTVYFDDLSLVQAE
jgi:hypothetical protein